MAASPPLQAILPRLEKLTGPDTAGWYTGLCVFHNDQKRPNLRVNDHGFACLACDAKGNLSALAHKLGLIPAPRAFDDRIIASYDYLDASGKLLFQVVRLLPKDFRQRRPDGIGGWVWSLKGVTPTLYRLPELFAADPAEPVFMPEGEKDVDRLRALGLTATTNPMGAGKWQARYSQALKGRHVVVLPDNDPPGRQHAKVVQASLRGVAASVCVVDLPGLPDKGDVADWLDLGGTADGLRDLVTALRMGEEARGQAPTSGSPLVSARDLVKMDLPEPRWAVPDIIPEGLAILGGKPKIGKSWLALNLGIAIASGGVALGNQRVEPGDVLYLSLEDTQRRLQSRLRDILGEEPAPAALTFACEWPRIDEGGLEELDLWLRTHPAARLVIIDTLAKVRSPRSRSDTLYEGDYASISGVKALADRHGVAIVVVHHLRKQDSSDPVDAISGTLGLAGAADAVLVLRRERGKHEASLFVTGRDLDEAEFTLQWEDRICSWAIVPDRDQEARLSSQREEIIAAIARNAGAPMSPVQVAQAVGKARGTIRKLLRSMERDGQLRSDEGLYWLTSHSINNGNSGNRSGSGNAGNTGNSPAPCVTPVTSSEGAEVTAQHPLLNLEQARSYRVTGVTADGAIA